MSVHQIIAESEHPGAQADRLLREVYRSGFSKGVAQALAEARGLFDELATGLDVAEKDDLPPIAQAIDQLVRGPEQGSELARLRWQWPSVPQQVHELARRKLCNPQTSADGILLLADALRELATVLRGGGLSEHGTDFWRLAGWLSDAATQRSGWEGGR